MPLSATSEELAVSWRMIAPACIAAGRSARHGRTSRQLRGGLWLWLNSIPDPNPVPSPPRAHRRSCRRSSWARATAGSAAAAARTCRRPRSWTCGACRSCWSCWSSASSTRAAGASSWTRPWPSRWPAWTWRPTSRTRRRAPDAGHKPSIIDHRNTVVCPGHGGLALCQRAPGDLWALRGTWFGVHLDRVGKALAPGFGSRTAGTEQAGRPRAPPHRPHWRTSCFVTCQEVRARRARLRQHCVHAFSCANAPTVHPVRRHYTLKPYT